MGNHSANSSADFTCPFCGRWARAEAPDPPEATFVVHAVPMCKTFERLTAFEYMRAVNKAMASVAPS
jgi:hypothetical protein